MGNAQALGIVQGSSRCFSLVFARPQGVNRGFAVWRLRHEGAKEGLCRIRVSTALDFQLVQTLTFFTSHILMIQELTPIVARNRRQADLTKMNGTPSQIEWAELIRPRVNAEFDRVAKALQVASSDRSEQDRLDVEAIVAILEEKRREVMSHDHAGYFIRNWQEMTDQVRQMIFGDPRYQAIRANRIARQ